MNAKVVVYLLISAFVLSGCASERARSIAAREAFDANMRETIERAQKGNTEAQALIQEIREKRIESDKVIEQYNKTQSEFLTWYDSLSVEQKAIFNRELEEKQIRYNQIHGFNPDGSSRYLNPEGDYWVDRLSLMDHYKPIWDH